jgi:hypothetical protein
MGNRTQGTNERARIERADNMATRFSKKAPYR